MCGWVGVDGCVCPLWGRAVLPPLVEGGAATRFDVAVAGLSGPAFCLHARSTHLHTFTSRLVHGFTQGQGRATCEGGGIRIK
jgi:hypothetical protein